jgi:large subunit ribosomal protein L4
MKYVITTLDQKKVGEVDLLESIFNLEPRDDILHRVVRWQMAKRRSGNHQTKTLSMVSGSTRKPFRQKGTGRARQGTIRAPQHRGGAVVFGPQTRDHSFDLPRKVRQLGLKMALSAKAKGKELFVVDSLALSEMKTKTLLNSIQKNKWDSVLFIDGNDVDTNFARASANIVGVDLLPQIGANVYSILKRTHLVLTKDAIDLLTARLS